MNPTLHLVWCHPDHCTVVDGLPLDGAAHQSKPVTVRVDDFEPRQATVWLYQPAAPNPVTFVAVDLDGAEMLLPVDVAQAALATLDSLLGRRVPPSIQENERAAETATRYGYPASADDDYCAVDGIEHGTTWLGADDSGRNWWVHNAGPEACGHRWSNPVRRPHNGVPIVLVTPVETICFYCGQLRQHATPEESEAYGAEHTAMHEGEVSS